MLLAASTLANRKKNLYLRCNNRRPLRQSPTDSNTYTIRQIAWKSAPMPYLPFRVVCRSACRFNVAFALMLTISACSGPATPEPGKPVHHLSDGTFVNTDGEAISKSLSELLRWWWEGNDPEPAEFELIKPDPALIQSPPSPQITWIGHATFLLQMDGLNILTDPHLTERASPVGFAGPKRMVAPALDFDELPAIDLVVISHSHYDHLDRTTVERLYQQQRDNPPHFLVPLGLAEWFMEQGIDSVTELDWWQSATVKNATITPTPVHHWSSRTPFDRNETLWAAWMIETDQHRFFHAGDSGYSDDFKRVGERFGPIDLATIPIGAYEPRWFMKASHINPMEAVQVFQDLGAERALAMHWGTFILTDEPVKEPPVKLAEALENAGIAEENFRVLIHGETVSF